MLRKGPSHFLFKDDGSAGGIICNDGKIFRAPLIFCSPFYCPKELLTSPNSLGNDMVERVVSRCICISERAIGDDGSSLLVLPPRSCDNSVPIRVLQLDWSTQSAPRGLYLWLLWASELGSFDLSSAVTLLESMTGSSCVKRVIYYHQVLQLAFYML